MKNEGWPVAGMGLDCRRRTEWSTGTKAHRDGVWVPIRTRSILIDGAYQYQSEDVEPESQLGA